MADGQYGQGLGDNQAGASLCPPNVEGDMSVSRFTLLGGIAELHRRHHHAIGKCESSQAQ